MSPNATWRTRSARSAARSGRWVSVGLRASVGPGQAGSLSGASVVTRRSLAPDPVAAVARATGFITWALRRSASVRACLASTEPSAKSASRDRPRRQRHGKSAGELEQFTRRESRRMVAEEPPEQEVLGERVVVGDERPGADHLVDLGALNPDERGDLLCPAVRRLL